MNRLLLVALLAVVFLSAGLAHAQSSETVIVPAPPPSYGALAPSPEGTAVLDAELAAAAPAAPVHHMDRGFVSAGTTLFLVAWTMNIPGSVLGRLLGSPTGDTALNYDMLSLIPLVGPIAQLGFMQGVEWTTVPLMITEACEIAGLVMMIVGAIGVDEPGALADVRVLPYASATSAGLSVGGAF